MDAKKKAKKPLAKKAMKKTKGGISLDLKSVSGESSASRPMEQLSLNYEKISW